MREGTRHGHYGEQSANAIWTDHQARIIRELHANGYPYNDLMRLWGGCRSALSDLCTGKTYQTAGGPIAGVDYPKGEHMKSVLNLLKPLRSPVCRECGMLDGHDSWCPLR